MKIELFPTSFLNVVQLGELTSNLDLIHGRVLKAIERLQNDVATRKAEIAGRWKQMFVDDESRRRFVAQENDKATSLIREGAKQELDRLLKEAGVPYHRITAQKPFYASRILVLNRQGLGTDKRAVYESTVEKARSVSLAGLMQLAIGTSDLVLAAALAQENDLRRDSDRGFDTVQALKLLKIEEYDKAQEYIQIAEVRFQAIVLAIRTWGMGRSNPLDTVSLAMRKREVESARGRNADV